MRGVKTRDIPIGPCLHVSDRGNTFPETQNPQGVVQAKVFSQRGKRVKGATRGCNSLQGDALAVVFCCHLENPLVPYLIS